MTTNSKTTRKDFDGFRAMRDDKFAGMWINIEEGSYYADLFTQLGADKDDWGNLFILFLTCGEPDIVEMFMPDFKLVKAKEKEEPVEVANDTMTKLAAIMASMKK